MNLNRALLTDEQRAELERRRQEHIQKTRKRMVADIEEAHAENQRTDRAARRRKERRLKKGQRT